MRAITSSVERREYSYKMLSAQLVSDS